MKCNEWKCLSHNFFLLKNCSSLQQPYVFKLMKNIIITFWLIQFISHNRIIEWNIVLCYGKIFEYHSKPFNWIFFCCWNNNWNILNVVWSWKLCVCVCVLCLFNEKGFNNLMLHKWEKWWKCWHFSE